MSPATTAGRPNRVLRFFEATIVKKAIVAVTGIVLFGFVVAHLLGNLQVFLGPERLNGYSAMLKNNIELLWPARIFLLVCVGAHIVATLQLARIKNSARPVAYAKKNNGHSSVASRTMYYSGPMILAFVIYHLLHMTLGTVHPQFSETDVYANLIYGFQQPIVAIAYVIAMALLCLHLNHGIWSIFQTLGLAHPAYTPRIKASARAVSILIFLGFVSIPAAVLAGIVHL